ncbi:MAG: phenylalanine--tRNA ligase beta subunit-related protein [Candidatus Kariarchaeaceae archaeon]|jgi:DNA/RNA-binding domain of Phe-tRNA-synthetase-like protein
MEVKISDTLQEQFPEITIGILIVKNVQVMKNDPRLESEKRKLESYIRKNYHDVENLAVIPVYNQFFKKFGKVYPIQYQIQSILSGKKFHSTFNIVEAMYLAELKNFYLTAGHDLDTLGSKLETKLTHGNEQYLKINGKEQKLKSGDIVTIDEGGIISSVLYGPDYRTQITEKTMNCLFFSYFPYGENNETIKQHFEDITNNIRIISDSETEFEETKIFE